MLTSALTLALVFQAAPAASADASASTNTENGAPAEATASTARPAKITDRSHPDFVRCRKEPMIGTLARFRKICMTNAEWELAARVGNQGARDIVEAQQTGMNSSN